VGAMWGPWRGLQGACPRGDGREADLVTLRPTVIEIIESVNAKWSEPEYQLVWPRQFFIQEAARLLNDRDTPDWDDRCRMLLDDAFVSGYLGGPVSELDEMPSGSHRSDSRGGRAPFSPRQQYLRELMEKANSLSEDPPERAPYYRERQAGGRRAQTLDPDATVSAFIALVSDLDRAGYFDRRFGPDCADDYRGDRPSTILERELGINGLWPLQHSLLADQGVFFDMVEVLHDHVARPRGPGWWHQFDETWHHNDFDIDSGRLVYRWRVNKILDRTTIGLRLSTEGDDVGRLVTTTDAARSELVHALVERSDTQDDDTDKVRHAIALFRARGADRNMKRSAVQSLALVLEGRRHDALAAAMVSKDGSDIFLIANKFHIRHQKADQQSDYPDFYLDWVFWNYLAGIELTNRVMSVAP
jgi:hypothetical protein